jgi:Gpi18-like mannosyltransferase
MDNTPEDAATSTLLLITSPLAFCLYVPYTESLFLLLSVMCIFLARHQRWWMSALAAGLASLTRQQGVFLVVPLAWEMWEAAGRSFAHAVREWKNWLSILLIPACLLPWICYRALAIHDLAPIQAGFGAFISSLLISTHTSKVVAIYEFTWPWRALSLAATKFCSGFDVTLFIDLSLAVVFLGLFAFSWRNLRVSYRLYALVIVLISFSDHTGPVHPYMGLPRHLFLALPILLVGLSHFLRPIWLRFVAVAACSTGMFVLLRLYFIQGWVP